jgi:hypothetical protein
MKNLGMVVKKIIIIRTIGEGLKVMEIQIKQQQYLKTSQNLKMNLMEKDISHRNLKVYKIFHNMTS